MGVGGGWGSWLAGIGGGKTWTLADEWVWVVVGCVVWAGKARGMLGALGVGTGAWQYGGLLSEVTT